MNGPGHFRVALKCEDLVGVSLEDLQIACQWGKAWGCLGHDSFVELVKCLYVESLSLLVLSRGSVITLGMSYHLVESLEERLPVWG